MDEVSQVVELECKGSYYLIKGTKQTIAYMVSLIKAFSNWKHENYLKKDGACDWTKLQEISKGTSVILDFPKEMFEKGYLITDIFSRDVVGWEVWDEQTAEHVSELIKKACIKQRRLSTTPLVLHSDNGTPMKGATMLATLYDLGITPSNSRPRVSNDNPYSESLFKTLKYRPNYQPKGFESIEEARAWCAKFVKWYRFEHHHSGIKFLTAAERHAGRSEEVLNKRHKVYEAAKAAHPERWNGRKTRDWSNIEKVFLNPDKVLEETKVVLDEEIKAS